MISEDYSHSDRVSLLMENLNLQVMPIKMKNRMNYLIIITFIYSGLHKLADASFDDG